MLAVGISYYIWQDLARPKNFQEEKEEKPPIAVDVEGKGNFKIEEIKKEDFPVPDLNRPLNFPPSFSLEAQKIAREKIEKLISDLSHNPNSFENWLVLGVYRKMINDYEGAKEYWEYATAINPNSSTPFNNLGDLYAYYLKDYQKAESYFLKAIKIDPQRIYIYRSLYELYRYLLKDENKAKQILQQGILANPTNSQDLQELLKSF